MSFQMLSQKLGEIMRLHPAFSVFFHDADGGAAKPDLLLAAWIDGLSEESLVQIGMAREEIAAHVASLAEEVEKVKKPVASISSLRILGGRDKMGREEGLDLTLRPGQIVCIVGPTGSGKSRLLADIECLAQGDTPSGRKILDRRRNPRSGAALGHFRKTRRATVAEHEFRR